METSLRKVCILPWAAGQPLRGLLPPLAANSGLRLPPRTLLRVLGRGLLEHQIFETKERLQDVFPERSASAQQQDRDQPSGKGGKTVPQPGSPLEPVFGGTPGCRRIPECLNVPQM